eukprot:scaffold9004_cov107-Cylindrotheca_fusiformis.AAC.6
MAEAGDNVNMRIPQNGEPGKKPELNFGTSTKYTSTTQYKSSIENSIVHNGAWAMLVKSASEAFAKEPGLNKLSRIMEEEEA